MLPEIFPLIAAAPAATAYLGLNPTRFYPHGNAPQDVAGIYATWFLVSGLPENTLSEVPKVDRFSVQIDLWSNNSGDGSEEVREAAIAVRDTLEPYMHMTGIVLDGVDPDTKRHRIGLQFTVFQDRDEHS